MRYTAVTDESDKEKCPSLASVLEEKQTVGFMHNADFLARVRGERRLFSSTEKAEKEQRKRGC